MKMTVSKVSRIILSAIILFVSRTYYERDSTVIAGIFRTKTPKDSAAIAVKIHWFITFGVVTTAARAYRFATTVIVRNEIIKIINGVSASADPGDG